MLNFEFTCSEENLQVPTDSFARFVSTPLEVGQGTTIGNILRRVCLRDLSGLSIVGVRINGIDDQFSILAGVREDVLEIILNLKEIIFKGQEEKETILRLKLQGPCVVSASKFDLPSHLEIMNPDHYIATISDTSILEMEIKLAWGQGYALNKNTNFQNLSNFLQVDSVFVPVKKVAFQIQHRFSPRLGSQEQLVFDIWTNGSITPSQAISRSSKIIVDWFLPLENMDPTPLQSAFYQKKASLEEEAILQEKVALQEKALYKEKIYSLPIENLLLSVRAYNGLKQAQINVLGDLLQTSVTNLKNIKNFGKKSLSEVSLVIEKYSHLLKE